LEHRPPLNQTPQSSWKTIDVGEKEGRMFQGEEIECMDRREDKKVGTKLGGK